MSHFDFLKPEFPKVYEAAVKAEEMALSDSRTALIYARRTVELAVRWMFRHDESLRLPYQDTVSALIHEPSFIQLAGPTIQTKSKLIIRLGNRAVHSTRKIKKYDVLSTLRELTHITHWLAQTYSTSGTPQLPVFEEDNLPKPAGNVTQLTTKKLIELQEELSAKDEKLSELLADKTRLDDELKALRKKFAEAKAANMAAAQKHDYNEEETRDYFIDFLLGEAGWTLDQERDQEYKVTGMPNDKGEGYVDYVLWGDDGKPLGLVEAKRTRRDPKEGKRQAELYADCLESEFKQRPVIFYSNGYEHYIWDDKMYPPRPIQGFLKKDELELIIQRRKTRESLNADDVNKKISGRPYQQRAIQNIVESFEVENRRKALLVMATGTGKTRTIIALADLLMQKNWAKRILFLADRVALVRQTVNAFKEHLPSASVVNLVTEKNEEGRVYVSTYPTMMGLIDGKVDDARKFGCGHFDLVIIDEAHRSVYHKYRSIFEYFDSYLVGLTATPRDEIDHNTYRLFDLEEGVPTDAYTLDEAVEQGYLVPPRSISVPLKFQREGIKYDELSDDEKDQWDAIEWSSEDGEKPDEVSAEAVNRWLFNIDTVNKALLHLMENGIRVAGGDRLGKTIIFAKNQRHADFIVGQFDKMYPQYKGKFAQVITFQTEYAQTLIDDFSVANKNPHIAISVDMLDTGIDIPEVVNLVLFKLIRSKTKFWQMLGRGTRLCKDLFGPGDDKLEFCVFDYCGNLEYFSQDMKEKTSSASMPLSMRLVELKMELIKSIDGKKSDAVNEGLQENTNDYDDGTPTEKDIRESTATELLTTIQELNLESFAVQAKRRHVEKYSDETEWETIDDTMIGEVVEHIASLPSPRFDPDEMAKRFDVLCLNLQLCILNANEGFERYAGKVKRIAEALLERQTIPVVQQQIPLLEQVVGEGYWQDITVPMLEILRVRVRSLVKYIDKNQRNIVYTNFVDEIDNSTEIRLTDSAERSLVKFRDKAKAFLRDNMNNVALNKLYMNKPLTDTDLSELERLFIEAGVADKEMLNSAAKLNEGSLGMFVRSLVGLENKAAQEAFEKFLEGKGLNANQHEFIRLVIDYLTEHGTVPSKALYESPFTKVAPQGPEVIFPDGDDADEIFQILKQVADNANARSAA